MAGIAKVFSIQQLLLFPRMYPNGRWVLLTVWPIICQVGCG